MRRPNGYHNESGEQNGIKKVMRYTVKGMKQDKHHTIIN